MRLTRLQRLGFALLGVAATAVGGWAYSRSEMTVPGLFAFLPGLILVAGALFGTAPNLTFKDAKIEWPKGDDPKAEAANNETKTAVDQLRAELAKTNGRLAESEKLLTDQGDTIEGTMAALKSVSDRFDDYVLAHEPAPDDGLSDDDRLSEMAEALKDNEQDYDNRRYHGIDRTDGIDTDQVGVWRDQARDDYRKELRRQQAQFKFGLRAKPPTPEL